MTIHTPFSDNMLMLAVGGQLPAMLHGGGVLLAPEVGLISVAHAHDFRRGEIEAVRHGPWSIGMLPGGMHATIVHHRFGVKGTSHGDEVGLAAEWGWGMGGPARSGSFPAVALEDDIAVCFVLADASGTVLALRYTALSRDDLAFFRADVRRQAKVKAIWSQEAQDRGFLREANRHGRVIPRSACSFWVDIGASSPDSAA